MAPATSQPISDTTLLAVITAAIHAAIEVPAKVLSIRQLSAQSPETARMVWALEGRRAISSSHKLR